MAQQRLSISSTPNLQPRISNDIPLAICSVPREVKIGELFLDLKRQGNY
jgi:hypothetical protein